MRREPRAVARALPVIVGAAIAWFPMLLPVLLLRSWPWRPRAWFAPKARTLWLAGAALAVPTLLAGQYAAAIGSLAGIVLLIPVIEASARERRRLTDATWRRLRTGFLIGLGALSLLLVVQSFADAPSRPGGVVGEPNLQAHTLVLTAFSGGLAFVGPPFGPMALVVLPGVAATGSRTAFAVALLAIVITTLTFVSRQSTTTRGRSLLAWSAVPVIVVAGALAGLLSERLDPTALRHALGPGSHNLLLASEDLDDPAWRTSGVEIRPSDQTGVLVIAKTATAPWARPQQVVRLLPDEDYVLSFDVRLDTPGASPGILGWGRMDDDETFSVAGTLMDESWNTTLEGPGKVVASGLSPADAGRWTHAWLAFTYAGDEPIAWSVGPVPDLNEGAGATIGFRHLQLTRGATQLPYQTSGPSEPVSGTASIVARASYWRVAWQGFLERPWFGWGEGSFLPYYRSQRGVLPIVDDYPRHAHNLVLDVAFRTGVIGLAGLATLIGVAFSLVRRSQRFGAVVVLGMALLLNVPDATFFHSSILFPVFGHLGWSTVVDRGRSP